MTRRTFIIVSIGILLTLAGIAYVNRGVIRAYLDERTKADLPPALSVNEATKPANANVNAENTNNQSPISNRQLPAEFNLAVPFTVQAPHANWDLPYKETCEEASALMVHFFYEGKQFRNADHADAEILKIVDFQNDRYGDYRDTTADETAQLIRDAWGYDRVDVVTDPTIEDIKREVAAGRPVILPAAGRQLGNPYFTPPGPLYHMLVVRGWTKDGRLITNDPGTRRGEEYLYDPDVLLNAVHDWNEGDVDNGRKVMIVVWPKGGDGA